MQAVLRRAAVCAALLAPGSVAAQAQPAERLHYVRIVARDYQFDVPARINPGLNTFHLVNLGPDQHNVQLHELPQGRSLKEFFDALQQSGSAPAWARVLGATPVIQKSGEAFITFRLAAGRYVLACPIPAADGRTHVSKGMYSEVTVAPAPVPRAPAKSP
jgi:hypothetical protein